MLVFSENFAYALNGWTPFLSGKKIIVPMGFLFFDFRDRLPISLITLSEFNKIASPRNYQKTVGRIEVRKLASHGTLLYLCLADLSRSFSQFMMSIFMFSQYIFNRFCPVEKPFLNWLSQYLFFLNIFFNRFCPLEKWKSVGCHPILLISWFINFN